MIYDVGRRTVVKALGAAGIVGLASDSAGASSATDARPPAQTRHGPTRTGLFTVRIDEIEIEGWQSVTLPGVSTEEGSYREGDDPDYEKELWGQTAFDDLEMERGVQPGDDRIWQWKKEIIEGRVDDGRKEVTVVWTDRNGRSRTQWTFTDAWIKEYDPPELDASADGDTATESITIAYDKMKREEA